MKYYSEKTKKMYDTEKELHKAEYEFDNADKLKAKRKEELDAAVETYKASYKEMLKLLNTYIKDYGSYRANFKSDDENWLNWPDFFDLFKM